MLIKLYETEAMWEVFSSDHYSHALLPEEVGDFISTYLPFFPIVVHRMV